MTRNLKVLGLALLAVFALSAVAASAASAANDVFTSNSSNEKTDLTGATETGVKPVLSTAAGLRVICEKGTYAGTITPNKVSSLTVHPIYDGPCEVEGVGSATVTTGGCDFVLTGETNASEDAKVHVECTTGRQIEIHVPAFGVTLDIGTQTNLFGVHYTNLNTEEKAIKTGEAAATVTVNATVTGITYSCTGEFCFLLPGGGSGNDAEYHDKVITTGFKDEGTFTQNSTTHEWSGTHGSQVHISVHPE